MPNYLTSFADFQQNLHDFKENLLFGLEKDLKDVVDTLPILEEELILLHANPESFILSGRAVIILKSYSFLNEFEKSFLSSVCNKDFEQLSPKQQACLPKVNHSVLNLIFKRNFLDYEKLLGARGKRQAS